MKKNLKNRRLALKDGDALMIIDVINHLDFPGGEKLVPWARRLAPKLAAFAMQARRAEIPVIYVNDHFGNWRNNFQDIYRKFTAKSSNVRDICQKLKPHPTDYFILKPRHSAFFSTSLIPLLEDLKIKRLILAGIATNLCVLFTAHDAHMHQYKLVVLSDCCAAESDFDHNVALTQLQSFCAATICRSDEMTSCRLRRS